MLGMEPLETMIRYCIYSGKLKNERPLSLIVAANPESGKTEALREFKCVDGIVYLTDCTAHGLTKEVLPRIDTGAVHHILIPDLLNPLSRKQSTVQTFVTFMNSLIEEGVAEISTYAQGMTQRKTDLRCGLVTAITKDKLKDKRHEWSRLGFLSRALPFSYSYGTDKVRQIMEYIISEKYHDDKPLKLKLPAKLVDVELKAALARLILPESYRFADANELYGFRFQRQLQVLMKSIALADGRRKVIKKDFNEAMRLMRWVNLDFAVL